MSSQVLRTVHVNREQELARFKGMIRGNDQAHILLVQAEAGLGKSSLLREFWDECKHLHRAKVNLKQMSYTVGEILAEMCDQLGADRFNRFYNHCQDFAGAGGVNIERSTLIGTQVEITLSKLDPDQRKIRRQMLTDAFINDLAANHAANQCPTVLLFDTFEVASDDVKEWLGGLFLTRVRPRNWLVVVIAGRAIPQLDIDWEDLSLSQTLRPLDRENVREYLRKVELQLEEKEIAVLYDITDGKPLELATHIGTLLLKRRPV